MTGNASAAHRVTILRTFLTNNPMTTKHLPKLIFAAVLIAAGVYYCQAQRGASTAGKDAFRQVLTLDTTPLKRESGTLKSYADVIEKVEPAVVKITTAQEVILRRRRSMWSDDPYVRRFFNIPDNEYIGPSVRQKRPLGLGSGVIVTKNGYILTNNHVIDKATEIKVFLPGKEEPLDGKVVNSAPDTDIAVIKVEASNLPVATLADSSQVRRGDIVFAVGAPFGYDQSVSMGIVSAIGRREIGVAGQGQENFIQTDAAINPGNSGGPLIDAEGRVIGINTAIYSNTGSNAGIGFAIPINRVVQTAAALVSGKVSGQSGYLGMETETVTEDVARYLKLPESRGVYVKHITEGSPAAQAGMQVDDVVLDMQGRKVEDKSQLDDEISALPPGREVTLGIWRNGEKKEIKVELGDRSKVAGAEAKEPADGLHYGLKLAALDDNYREQLGLSADSRGLVVLKVTRDSPADAAGFSPGDLIVRINRDPVATMAQAEAAFSKASDGQSLIHVWRNGRTATVLLRN